jgi:SAM-dependent methyltransferase
VTTWEGDEYQARFDRLAATGAAVHGEADLVTAYGPSSVLDAGCGTGRVGIELARRGVEVVGADVDPSMLATARRLAPDLTWVEADLTELDLGRTFDLVLLAGNVPLFTPPGTQPALVTRCAAHVAAGGRLVAGFSLDRGYGLDAWDEACAAAGLTLVDRFATWSREPFTGGDYAVSVHGPSGRPAPSTTMTSARDRDA